MADGLLLRVSCLRMRAQRCCRTLWRTSKCACHGSGGIREYRWLIQDATADAATSSVLPRSRRTEAAPCWCAPLQEQAVQLQRTQADEVETLQQEAAAQLAEHVAAADRVIAELEAAAVGLQAQLASELQRSDTVAGELWGLQQERERNKQHVSVVQEDVHDQSVLPSQF